ncbi:MFS transporter [Thermotoga sp. KOL6]|uniref:MFS transporter n=1 Tax=Thermotoga sp. KOL6 TaxID=126741 RepID=UPI000C78A821|nr:MFS transporter [Thermotoga sp. KOL6]PLV59105.1 MFS transporter [Thermotoga sp. KOL6]
MLFLTNTLRSMGTMSFNLLIQLRMKEIGATLFLIGLLSSLRGAVGTFSNLFWGRISDKTGRRKPFLISSLVLASAFYPLYAVINSPLSILIISMVIAFFNGMYPPAAMALSSTKKRMALGFSLYNSSNSLGMLLSRLSIGFLLIFIDLKMAFVFFSIVIAVAVIPILMLKEKKLEKKREEKHFKRLVLENGTWAVYVGSLLRQMGTSGSMSLIAVYLNDTFHFDASTIGFITSVNPLIQIPSHFLFGRLSEKIDPKIVSALGIFLSALTPFLMMVPERWAPVLAYATLGTSFGAFINGTNNFLGRRFHYLQRGQALGLLSSARFFGATVGPLLAGILAEKSYDLMFSVLGSVILLGGLVVLFFTRSGERSPAS